MKDFEDFWKEHGEDYIAHIKTVAMKDFKILNNTPDNKFVSQIDIETDDDFYLDGGNSFLVYGNGSKDILKKTIAFLRKIKLIDVPEWAKTPDGIIKDSYTSKWHWVRDEAIQRLQNGETFISFGGNQTIEILISENKPSTELSKFKK